MQILTSVLENSLQTQRKYLFCNSGSSAKSHSGRASPSPLTLEGAWGHGGSQANAAVAAFRVLSLPVHPGAYSCVFTEMRLLLMPWY